MNKWGCNVGRLGSWPRQDVAPSSIQAYSSTVSVLRAPQLLAALLSYFPGGRGTCCCFLARSGFFIPPHLCTCRSAWASFLSFPLPALVFLQVPGQVSSPSGPLPCSAKLRRGPAKLPPGVPVLRGPGHPRERADTEVLFSRTPPWQRSHPLISSWGCGCRGQWDSERKENESVCYLLGFCFKRWDANVGAKDLEHRLGLPSKQINNIGVNRVPHCVFGGLLWASI